MVVINYPEPAFRVRKHDGGEEVFDPIRRKWVMLTPEEWVRLNFIQYLLVEKKYPVSLVAIEKEIRLGELKKRFDILVYSSNHVPWLMVECKAMDIQLNEKVFLQVLTYNTGLQVPFIVITNGNFTMGWKKGETGFYEINELPAHE
jgi:hypothetical protein